MTTVFSRLARSCVSSVFVLIAAVPISSRAEVSVAMTESPQHLERHRESTRQFRQKLKADPRGALADALAGVQRSRSLGRNDPLRADALEMLSHAYLTAERFDKALPLAAEVVRIRKVARPVDDELLALALDTYATLLFAHERSAESDAALSEALAAWRRAYGANDLRLAPILEGQAEYVQKAFGRPLWTIELLREAVAIRSLNPQSSGGKLAETLSELAIHEMRQAQYGECDGHLAKAQQLIEAEMGSDPEGQELKAGLVQVLAMRAGIAAVLGRKDPRARSRAAGDSHQTARSAAAGRIAAADRRIVEFRAEPERRRRWRDRGRTAGAGRVQESSGPPRARRARQGPGGRHAELARSPVSPATRARPRPSGAEGGAFRTGRHARDPVQPVRARTPDGQRVAGTGALPVCTAPAQGDRRRGGGDVRPPTGRPRPGASWAGSAPRWPIACRWGGQRFWCPALSSPTSGGFAPRAPCRCRSAWRPMRRDC